MEAVLTLIGLGTVVALIILFFVAVVSEMQRVESGEPTSEEVCSLYFARLFEQRLVSAGVIQPWDMSTCDNRLCEDCRVTLRWIATKKQQEIELQNEELNRLKSEAKWKKKIVPKSIFTETIDIMSDQYIKPVASLEFDEVWVRHCPCPQHLDTDDLDW